MAPVGHTARAAITAANVVLSFNQITFRAGLLFSLSGTRIHYRKHCSGKVTVVSTSVQHSRWTRIEKLYHVNDHKTVTGLGLRFFPQVSYRSSAVNSD